MKQTNAQPLPLYNEIPCSPLQLVVGQPLCAGCRWMGNLRCLNAPPSEIQFSAAFTSLYRENLSHGEL